MTYSILSQTASLLHYPSRCYIKQGLQKNVHSTKWERINVTYVLKYLLRKETYGDIRKINMVKNPVTNVSYAIKFMGEQRICVDIKQVHTLNQTESAM